MAKHRTHVIQSLAAFVQHGMLNNRAHHPCRGFRTERQVFTVQAILERIHLFFHNVRDLTQSAHKQRCRLHNGGAQIAIGVLRHQFTNALFQPLPPCRIGRKNIVHAFDGAQFFGCRRATSFCGTHGVFLRFHRFQFQKSVRSKKDAGRNTRRVSEDHCTALH